MKKKINQYFAWLSAYYKKEKKKSILFGVITLVCFVFILRYVGGVTTTTQYVYGTVKKGTVESVVSGSGQVSGLGQIDLKAKASGDIANVLVAPGTEVKAGQLLANLDTRDALINLKSAEIAYQKLTQPADAITLLQAQNALVSAKQSETQAQASLIKSYDDGFGATVNFFLDAPVLISGIADLLSGSGYLSWERVYTSGNTARAYQEAAEKSYYNAKNVFEKNNQLYKGMSRSSATSSVEAVTLGAYESTQALAAALKDAQVAVEYIRNSGADTSTSGAGATARTNIATWTGTTNGHLSALLSAITARENAKSALVNASASIREKTESLIKTQNGADPLDVASGELTLRQKQYAYQDYFIRAPFDGVIAKWDVKKTDNVSGGTVVGVLVTKQKIAAISLNEVDAAKIKIGQKVSLSFDAIDGLAIDGIVSEVDLVGTVSQGVVTYGVKIQFDTQDERVRSGMSVNATIVTESKADVLVVPSAAIKTMGNKSYVEIPGTTSATVKRQFIEMGLVGDSTTEIVSGLSEGDRIVVRTITSTTKTTTAPSATSLFGGNRGTGATRGVTR